MSGMGNYDAWKLASPPYCDGPDEEECDHEEYEIDWEGRAECSRCQETWWPSAEIVRMREIAALRAERHWRRYNSWYMRTWRWLTERRQRTVPDDDIPF